MNRRIRLAAAALFVSAPAFAADYDPPIFVEQAPEYVPVEVGSGWYLRGDIGYNVNRTYENDSFSFPVVVAPFTVDSSFSEDELPVFASVGIGYHWNDYFRTELNAGFLSRNEESASFDTFGPGGAGVDILLSEDSALAENTSWFGMANAFVDLGTYAGFTPYVGGGIGLVHSRRVFSTSTDFSDPAVLDSSARLKEDSFDIAYTLNAGVSYAATKNLSIDLGYQYFSAPDTEYVQLTGPTSASIEKGLDFHQVKVGLRYDLW